jgi:hypothetical protein
MHYCTVHVQTRLKSISESVKEVQTAAIADVKNTFESQVTGHVQNCEKNK